jgi:NAD(P)-dependent dehydrogenase (short-subunit alcohol dehydrogenase family)
MFHLKDRVAFVSGANRGLGRAFCDGLLQGGIRKLYATARDPSQIHSEDPRIMPIKLDVTSSIDVRTVADSCADVDLLINNAGVLRNSSVLAEDAEAAARLEMETNFFGMLKMVRAFSPVLAANGGGANVNVLSVASWFGNPMMATYCASKAAALSLTNSLRIELRAQKTLVLGVYAGYLETDMAANVSGPKTPPMQVVERTFQGLKHGIENVMADDRAVTVDNLVRNNPEELYAGFQRRWDER